MRSSPRRGQPVYEITGARRGLDEDVTRRQVRYAIGMGIRTICVILAIVVTHAWLRVLFLLGAVLLPYLAVVYANEGREPRPAARRGYNPNGPAEIVPRAQGPGAP